MADFSSLLAGTDNCSSTFTYNQSVAIGDTLLTGSSTVVWMYLLDGSGNQDSCSFTLDVIDNTAPDLTCPNNPAVPTDVFCQFQMPSYDTVLNVVDNCDPSITFTQTPIAGTILNGVGTTQNISLFATDGSGNTSSCSFIITLADTTSPSIFCPGDQTLDINSFCQYTLPDFSGITTATDFCDPSPQIWQSPGIGVDLIGINTITMTAQDSSGNIATCTFDVYPNDTVNPGVVCPGDITSCDSLVAFNLPVASDDCGTVTLTQTDGTGLNSGSFFPVDSTVTLSWEAMDEVGNTATCSVDITVYPPLIIEAGPSHTIDEGESVQLDGSVTNGTSLIWTPDYYIDDDTIEDPTVSPNVTTLYYITDVTADGCTGYDSTYVLVNTINNLVINNFLSPNGDGSNDTWNVNKPSLISGCFVNVYSRWGRLVWQSSAYANDWDGTNTVGEPLPEGTYYYVISCGEEEHKGSVLLMR